MPFTLATGDNRYDAYSDVSYGQALGATLQMGVDTLERRYNIDAPPLPNADTEYYSAVEAATVLRENGIAKAFNTKTVPKSTVEYIINDNKRLREQQRLQELGSQTTVGDIGLFVAGMAPEFLDPINLAVGAFSGGSTFAAGAARTAGRSILGRTAIYARRGAVEGLVSGAATSALDASAEARMGREYTAADFFTNVLAGSFVGGAISGVGGAIDGFRVNRKVKALEAIDIDAPNFGADLRKASKLPEIEPLQRFMDNLSTTERQELLGRATAQMIATGRVDLAPAIQETVKKALSNVAHLEVSPGSQLPMETLFEIHRKFGRNPEDFALVEKARGLDYEKAKAMADESPDTRIISPDKDGSFTVAEYVPGIRVLPKIYSTKQEAYIVSKRLNGSIFEDKNVDGETIYRVAKDAPALAQKNTRFFQYTPGGAEAIPGIKAYKPKAQEAVGQAAPLTAGAEAAPAAAGQKTGGDVALARAKRTRQRVQLPEDVAKNIDDAVTAAAAQSQELEQLADALDAYINCRVAA